MSFFNKVLMAILAILFIFLLFFVLSDGEYYIDSGTLKFREKVYFGNLVVMDKITETKLSDFIQKNNFFRETNYVLIQNKPSAIQYAQAERYFKIFEEYLFPLYEKKLIDKYEIKIFINNMMDMIEKNNFSLFNQFTTNFFNKYEKEIEKL